MKILQINSVYNNGSTGKIVFDIHDELRKKGIESIVCYGRGEKIFEKDVYRVCNEFYSNIHHFLSFITGVPYTGYLFSTLYLISIIKKEKPDVVHIHCLNGYYVNIYKLIDWLKKRKIKTVLTLHAEFMYTGGCGMSQECNKWRSENGCGKCPRLKKEFNSLFFDRTNYMLNRMKKAFDHYDTDKIKIVSVSPWLMQRAVDSKIFNCFYNTFVYNGLNTDIFSFNLKKNDSLINLGKKIVLHVTQEFDNDPKSLKGGYYLIQLAKLLNDRPIHFVVVGNYKNIDSLPSNITILGKITDQDDLASLYRTADLTVITSRQETFSMVTAESLCCGTPVVGFLAGGPESIAIQEYTKFVEYGNIENLSEEILRYLDKQSNKEEISKKALFKYSRERMVENYIDIYSKNWSEDIGL